MKCKHAKHEIALSIGKDLTEPAEEMLQRHLAACPDCRDYHSRMQVGLSVLQDCDDEVEHQSVWPAVESRLAELPEPAAERSSLSLAPAFAVVAASLIMYLSMDSFQVPRTSAPVGAAPASLPRVIQPTPIIAPAGNAQPDFFRELQRLQNSEARRVRDEAPGIPRRQILEYR